VIDWIGFKDNETLVTVGDQKLTVWKVPSFKGIYESDGGYEGTVAWGHDKTWLAVSAGNHVDLIDTTTGEILNQVWIHPTYRIFDLAVDPLGKRLIAFAVDPEAATAKNLNKLVAGAIVSCDLETGKCHSITGDFPLNEIAFCSDDHWVLTRRFCLGTGSEKGHSKTKPGAADVHRRRVEVVFKAGTIRRQQSGQNAYRNPDHVVAGLNNSETIKNTCSQVGGKPCGERIHYRTQRLESRSCRKANDLHKERIGGTSDPFQLDPVR